MRILIGFCCLMLLSCSRRDDSETGSPEVSFSFDRTMEYELALPIPEGDEWLATFKAGHGYGDGWETWVWRKTDIQLGDGIVVYARNTEEVQFLVSGVPDLGRVTVNFRDQSVGEGWSLYGSHTGALTPSENYVVVITENPGTYLANGMSLKERMKTDAGWDFAFEGERVSWWERAEE